MRKKETKAVRVVMKMKLKGKKEKEDQKRDG